MNEKIKKWRNSRCHRRCQFCLYLRYVCGPFSGGYYDCKAKSVIISNCKMLIDCTNIPRPFCKCFILKEEDI